MYVAPSRCRPFFRTQQSNTQNVFWEPGDNHNEPSSSAVEASQSRCLLVSNLLHSFYCFECNFTVTVTLYFHENSWSTINFKTENGSRLVTDYAFTICVDEFNFLHEKFRVSAYSQDRLVAK